LAEGMAGPIKLLQAMTRVELLRGVPVHEVESLIGRGKTRTYPRGAYLFYQGDQAEEVFFILDGRIEVAADTVAGQRVLSTIVQQAQFFGEVEVLAESRRRGSAVADDLSTVWVARKEAFLDFIETHPKVALRLLCLLARRVQAHDNLARDLTTMGLRGRVAKWLLALASGTSTLALPRRSVSIAALPVDVDAVTTAFTQSDLANLCGASRENVARVLSEFQRRGFIERERQHYRIKDPKQLRRLAGISEAS
jgi:CRP/FNR family transcriptional regulator, cyclic AMP receptor protein